MEAEPFKLKPRPEGGYSAGECAASRCHDDCDVIDGTSRIWDFNVPLCSHHFGLRPDPPPMSAKKTSSPEVQIKVEDPPESQEIVPKPEPKPEPLEPKADPKPRRQKLESYRLF